MASARDTLAAVAAGVHPRQGVVGQVSNADGAVITDGADFLTRLVNQVASPVRWDLCMATLREVGVGAVVELPPAGVLAGIARRELPGVTVVPVKSPADIPAARELLAAHTAPGGIDASQDPADAGTLVVGVAS
jgi:[acyl-carrier-protein] S-malonyltransferase